MRELVNHIVTGNYWADELGGGQDHRGGRRPPRRRRARRPTRSRAYDDSAAGRGRGVPRAGCDGTRRARCRTGRCPGRCTAATASSTCWSTGGTSPTSTGQDTTLDPDLVDACWEVVEPQLDDARRQRRVRHARSTCPTTPTRQTEAARSARPPRRDRRRARSMGQYITVSVQAGASPSVRIFNLNRSHHRHGDRAVPVDRRREGAGVHPTCSPAGCSTSVPTRSRCTRARWRSSAPPEQWADARAEGDRDHRAPLRLLRRRRRAGRPTRCGRSASSHSRPRADCVGAAPGHASAHGAVTS